MNFRSGDGGPYCITGLPPSLPSLDLYWLCPAAGLRGKMLPSSFFPFSLCSAANLINKEIDLFAYMAAAAFVMRAAGWRYPVTLYAPRALPPLACSLHWSG